MNEYQIMVNRAMDCDEMDRAQVYATLAVAAATERLAIAQERANELAQRPSENETLRNISNTLQREIAYPNPGSLE